VAVGAAVYFAANSGSTGRASLVGDLEASPASCRFEDGDRALAVANPPAGGAMAADAAPPNFYKAGRAPSDAALVRALSRGFVVAWYRLDLSSEEMAKLVALSDHFGRALIVVPRPTLEGKVAVTAWHRRLHCAGVDPTVLGRFIAEFSDKAPEKGFV